AAAWATRSSTSSGPPWSTVSPEPAYSGRITRKRVASTGACSNQCRREPVVPWTRTTGSPAPWSSKETSSGTGRDSTLEPVVTECRIPGRGGVELHVRVWPDGDGLPFLLVHGLA